MEQNEIEAEVNAAQEAMYRYLTSVTAAGVGMMPTEMTPYWQGHRPRFDLQVRWFIEKLAHLEEPNVLDVGTGFPFATAYFALRRGGHVWFGCPIETMPAPVPNTHYVQMNLCYPLPGPWDRNNFDLVVCTECLEHLSCNLYTARNRLIDAIRPDGYLLLSFPLLGHNAKDYHLEWPERFDQISDPHVREFTEQTMREFVAVTGLKLIAEQTVHSPAYGGPIGHALMQKAGD